MNHTSAPGHSRYLMVLLLGVGLSAALAVGCRALDAAPTVDPIRSDPTYSDPTYSAAPEPPLPSEPPTAQFDPAMDLASGDGSVIARSTGSEVSFFDGDDGIQLATAAATGELRVLSHDGSMAATHTLSPDGRSEITVVDRRTTQRPNVSVIEVGGLVEPEAFSTDGSVLYVIDHSVAGLGTYRVRPLDLSTEQLGQMLGSTKQPISEDMNGAGGRQVWSRDGQRLYTLYIRQTHHHHDAPEAPDSHPEAGTDGFVHVLDLAEEWAHCLDLPTEFGAGTLSNTALAVSPDGTRLAVLDAEAGAVAMASTEDLAVTGVMELQRESGLVGATGLHLAMTSNHFAFGVGDEVRWIDQAGSGEVASFTKLAAPIAALTTGRGDAVWAWSETLPAAELRAPAQLHSSE